MDEFDEIREHIPFESPVKPAQLTLDSEFRFNCHPGISCFNECCKNIDIVLTPYDIVRLKRRLDLRAGELVARYTTPFEMDFHGLPGLKLATKPKSSACVFLQESGCSVYEDRPAACRYYALGNMGVRSKDASSVEDVYFVVKEPHCKGHEEPLTQTVREYREGQGADAYDEMNREWRDIIIKKRSSGPTVGAPSERSMQLFDMCSYDMDSFREFLQSPGFQSIFDLPEDESRALLDDENKLLRFSFRFLKQVLFGEFTIPRREKAREQRISERKEVWKSRKEKESSGFREKQEDLKYSDAQQFSATTNSDNDGSPDET
ncbi:MAG: YkgJ family cysteine cluster protein [Pseudomonadota bacterium]|nr:YkgJ family cysteine cluster protein [Pseudomonadota bacterium]